jgi:hypothetical protein
MIRIFVFALSMIVFMSSSAFAAIGCTLNDPDRDVKRIFPESTAYRTYFISIEERGGESLFREVEEKLGDALDTKYEVMDTPYAYYDILKGKDVIGRIHGVNQKGTYGGMQIILATDVDGRIIDMYYQKISSPEARRFRDKGFTETFHGLTLEDLYNAGDPDSGITAVKDPSDNNADDFTATLRGIKKNLILLDEFMLDNRYDKYYNSLEADKNEEK